MYYAKANLVNSAGSLCCDGSNRVHRLLSFASRSEFFLGLFFGGGGGGGCGGGGWGKGGGGGKRESPASPRRTTTVQAHNNGTLRAPAAAKMRDKRHAALSKTSRATTVDEFNGGGDIGPPGRAE